MSDVEFMTQRNWEQRRHAEEYAAKLAEENKVIYLERIATAPAEPRNDSENRKALKRNRRWMAKAVCAIKENDKMLLGDGETAFFAERLCSRLKEELR